MKNLEKLNRLEVSNRLMYYNLYYEMTNEDTAFSELSTKGAVIGLTIANFLFWILGIKLFSLDVKHSFFVWYYAVGIQWSSVWHCI